MNTFSDIKNMRKLWVQTSCNASKNKVILLFLYNNQYNLESSTEYLLAAC